jgi:phosphatidylglycerophosphate synthase
LTDNPIQKMDAREMSETPEPVPKTDCYSDRERKGMEQYQTVKAILLRPVLNGLSSLNVTPDAVTMIAGGIGLAFIPFWLTNQFEVALVFLLVHVLLDGLDGALARHQNVASTRGSFTDTFVDQMVVTGVTIAWIVMAPTAANIVAGAMFVFLYVLVVALAMARNALSVPFRFLVRPRYFVYASLALDGLMATQGTFYVLLISDLLLASASVTGYWVLRQQLPGAESAGGKN